MESDTGSTIAVQSGSLSPSLPSSLSPSTCLLSVLSHVGVNIYIFTVIQVGTDINSSVSAFLHSILLYSQFCTDPLSDLYKRFIEREVVPSAMYIFIAYSFPYGIFSLVMVGKRLSLYRHSRYVLPYYFDGLLNGRLHLFSRHGRCERYLERSWKELAQFSTFS